MLKTTAALLSLTVALSAAPQAPPPSAQSLAAQIQKRYASIPGFTADFTQEEQSALLPQVEKSSGTVKILRPSRMWWTYEKPIKKQYIVDGRYMWDYDVANKVVFRSDFPKGNDLSTPLLFLAGRGDLTKDFLVSLSPAQPDEWHLDLRPKTPNADFELTTLIVRRGTLALIGMTTVSPDGRRNAIRLTNLNESARLTPASFEFKRPSDVQLEIR
jgi:outer membrane lipoprotein carrier protein